MIKSYLLVLVLSLSLNTLVAQHSWKAQWIRSFEQQNITNTWTAYHKRFNAAKMPSEAIARIACDSKYWLWINGELVVFEGQLKRGPTPDHTYYDEVDIAPYLEKGDNSIAILVWYFGKDGFSHNSSSKAALIFDCQGSEFELLTDYTWKASNLNAFEQAGEPFPNFRLPESSIRYDARKGNFDFTKADFSAKGWRGAVELGTPPMKPWNELIKRPIPLWKDFGMQHFENDLPFPFISEGDTIVAKLPYNAQVTPYLHIEAQGGEQITILMDHYQGGGPYNVRAEYIARKGTQEYESLGWMNGEEVYFIIPKGVKVFDLKYRETGYDTEFTGSAPAPNSN